MKWLSSLSDVFVTHGGLLWLVYSFFSRSGTRDKPLRTSAWEATGFISQPLIGETYGLQKKSLEYVSHKPSRNSVLHTLQELPVPVRNWLDDQRRITCREASYFFVFCFIVQFDSWMSIFQSIFSIISSPDVNKESYFFPSLRAGGILQILQSDWFRERAVFYDLAR